MRQGGQRRLTWNDRRGADEMHRGRDLARTFEAWHGQLHIGVGELDDGMEKRRRSRTDIKAAQLLVQTKERRLTNPFVKLPRDIRVLLPLRLGCRRRQAKEVRRAVAENDGRSL